MDEEQFRKLLNEKLEDARFNYKAAEKKCREEKAKYETVLKEIQMFDDYRLGMMK